MAKKVADKARISGRHKNSPFKLVVTAHPEHGVFFDLDDGSGTKPRMVFVTTEGRARLLAQWILDHVEEP